MAVIPRFSVITIGVVDVGRSAAFYEKLGFKRKVKQTGNEVAFFETGATAFSLFAWDRAAAEAALAELPRPTTYRGVTLAWNCNSAEEVDAAMAHSLAAGAKLLKAAHQTSYGGYAGYFADPDGHSWEVVTAPGITVAADGRVNLPD
jgi:predicted lactoylglutathione lyase